ncbi:MAG: 3'(2'),5'-bisphosphate nucleotidase CysQ [Gammaproteobacteria bacterium]|nr:3'(2'),5'-bisphosphate nucleotidase CysQ [Gammaproteobacteria bacterium]
MLHAKKIISNTHLLASLVQLTKGAGDTILEIYQSDDFSIESKADASPVTAADLAAHHFIVAGLKRLTPHIPVVSEEDADSLKIPHYNACYWLIDPLDGTKEFISKNGEFTVNLALIEANKTSFGLVGVPVENTAYWGGGGLGAFKQVQNGTAVPTALKCIAAKTPIRVLASKSHLNNETKELINNLGPVTLIQAGSSLKFIRIAEGLADYYPRLAPTCEWDTAAAQAILEGAGGTVTQANGEPMKYGKKDILNPFFIAQGKS